MELGMLNGLLPLLSQAIFAAHMPDMEYCGRIARLMIANHHRSRPTPKTEICETLGIHNGRLNPILSETNAYLWSFELEIVGVGPSGTLPLEQTDKIFLRRQLPAGDKRVRLAASEDEKRLFFLFAVIQIENGQLAEDRLEALDECRLFAGISIGEFMKQQKAMGYFSSRKQDEDVQWTFGWRYYAELEDRCDVVEYFKESMLGGAENRAS